MRFPSYDIRFVDLLKPEVAALKLGISKSHLRELTIAKRVPAIDLGKSDHVSSKGRRGKHMWRYHEPTLDAWVAKKMLERLALRK